jgi:hypothetical protein
LLHAVPISAVGGRQLQLALDAALVLGFGWRHDVIGYDGLSGARYVFAAVALEDSASSRCVGAPPLSTRLSSRSWHGS